MAQPQITVEQVQHLLNGAETHIETHNQSKVVFQIGQAIVAALLLQAQEMDQISDALAVIADLKTAEDVTLT